MSIVASPHLGTVEAPVARLDDESADDTRYVPGSSGSSGVPRLQWDALALHAGDTIAETSNIMRGMGGSRRGGRVVVVVGVALCCVLGAHPAAPPLNGPRELSLLSPQLQSELAGLSRSLDEVAKFSDDIAPKTFQVLVEMLGELWALKPGERHALLSRGEFRRLLPEPLRGQYEKALAQARTATASVRIAIPEQATEGILLWNQLRDDLEVLLEDQLARPRPSMAELAAIGRQAYQRSIQRAIRIAQAKLVLDAPIEILQLIGIDRRVWSQRLGAVFASGTNLLDSLKANPDKLSELSRLRSPTVRLEAMDKALDELVGRTRAWLGADHRVKALAAAATEGALSTAQRFPELPTNPTPNLRFRFRIAPPNQREPTTSAALSLVQTIVGAEADRIESATKERHPVELEFPTGVVFTHVLLEKASDLTSPPSIRLTPTSLVTTVRIDKKVATDLLHRIGLPTIANAVVLGVDVLPDISRVSFRYRCSLPELAEAYEGMLVIQPGVTTLENLREQALEGFRAEFEKAARTKADDLAKAIGVDKIREVKLDPKWATSSLGGVLRVTPPGWVGEDIEVRFRIDLVAGQPRFQLASTTLPMRVHSHVQELARAWLEVRINAIQSLVGKDESLSRFLAYVVIKDLRFDANARSVAGRIALSVSIGADWFEPLPFRIDSKGLVVDLDEKAFALKLAERLPSTFARVTGWAVSEAYFKGKKFEAFGFRLEVLEDPATQGANKIFDVVATAGSHKATLKGIIYSPATKQLDFSKVKFDSNDLLSMLRNSVPSLPQSALRMSTPRFSGNAILFDLSLQLQALDFELPIGEVTLGTTQAQIALPKDLPDRIVAELTKRLPTLALTFGKYGQLSDIKVGVNLTANPIEVWVSGNANLGGVLSTRVRLRVSPSFKLETERTPSQLLLDVLRSVGLDFLKEIVPCPGLKFLDDAIGLECPKLEFSLPIVDKVGFKITMENIRVSTTGIQMPESFGVSIPLPPIVLPLDLWLVDPRFQFNRIRKELTISADITWGAPEAKRLLKLAADLTAPILPTRFELSGRLILGGFLELARTVGTIDFMKAEAHMKSETVGPLAKVFDVQQALDLWGKDKLIKGHAHVRTLGLDLVGADLLIDGNRALLDFKAKVDLPLVGRQAVVVEAGLAKPLDSRLGYEFSIQLGPFTLGEARFFLTPTYARLSFKVLGIPFTIQMPHIWAITPDLVLRTILSVFDFNPAAIVNLIKKPTLEFDLTGGNGKAGDRGNERQDDPISTNDPQRRREPSGGGGEGPKQEGTQEARTEGNKEGDRTGGERWTHAWGDIAFDPVVPPWEKFAHVVEVPDRKILGAVRREDVANINRTVRFVDRFVYEKKPCVRNRIWTHTAGPRKGTSIDCEFLILLGNDNMFHVMSMSYDWDKHVMTIGQSASQIFGTAGADLYNTIRSKALRQSDRRYLIRLAKLAINESAGPRKTVRWDPAPAPDASGIELPAGVSYIIPAKQGSADGETLHFITSEDLGFTLDMSSALFTSWAKKDDESPNLRNLFRLWASSKSIAVLAYEQKMEDPRLLVVAKRGKSGEEKDTLWLVDNKGLTPVGELIDAVGPRARLRDPNAPPPKHQRGTIEPFSIPYPITKSEEDPQIAVLADPDTWWSSAIEQLAALSDSRVHLLVPQDPKLERRMFLWGDRRVGLLVQKTGPAFYAIERSRFDFNERAARTRGTGWILTPAPKVFRPSALPLSAQEERERDLAHLLFLYEDEWRDRGTTHPLALFSTATAPRRTP